MTTVNKLAHLVRAGLVLFGLGLGFRKLLFVFTVSISLGFYNLGLSDLYVYSLGLSDLYGLCFISYILCYLFYGS